MQFLPWCYNQSALLLSNKLDHCESVSQSESAAMSSKAKDSSAEFIDEDDFADQEGLDAAGDSADEPTGAQTKEVRMVKRPKRQHRVSFPGASTAASSGVIQSLHLEHSQGGGHGSSHAPAALGKNSRRSRTGLRGLPKKGGGGGKGVWGKPGSEIDAVVALDERDPNYDSDTAEAVRLQLTVPKLTLEQFESEFGEIVKEFFEHGQFKEVIAQLHELRMNLQHKQRIPYVAISASMQRHALQRELTSQLLGSLVGPSLTSEELTMGFDQLLKEVDDLTIDLPEAPDMIGKFIARAIADDLLPPKFVHAYKGKVDSANVVKALAKAENLLTMPHSMYCLDKVWGVSGHGLARPTKHLIKKMKLLLEEYLSSNDIDEAMRCVKELDAPHFHHELVYQCVLIVLERSNIDTCQRVCTLMKSLTDTVLITVDQLEKGIRRIYQDMPDIQLDVPNAYLLLERFCKHAAGAACISRQLQSEMPTKGRKRFVSEGDGGLVKPRLPRI